MRFTPAVWVLLTSSLVCLSGCVILRPYREKVNVRTKSTPSSRHAMTSMTSSSWGRSHGGGERRVARTSRLARFQPSKRRCCKIGERVAKKTRECNISFLALKRKFRYEYEKNLSKKLNRRVRKRSRLSKLEEKTSRCSASYPISFEKCCNNRKTMLDHLRLCRLKPRKQRRRCKQAIRKRYS